jgi:hypothetical protein
MTVMAQPEFSPLPHPIGEDIVEAQLHKLRLVKGRAGFYPTNRGEANRAAALIDYLDHDTDTGVYLNDILVHQENSRSKHPVKALQVVTGEMASYAGKARSDRTRLGELSREVVAGLQPENLHAPVDASRYHDGLGQIVRYLDLRDIATTGTTSHIGFNPFDHLPEPDRPATDPYTVPYPKDKVGLHIVDTVSALTNSALATYTEAAMFDQESKFTFWTDRLKAATYHADARKAAELALDKLGYSVE